MDAAQCMHFKKYNQGRRFKREGTYEYLWLIHVEVGQKLRQYYKAITLQLKILKNINNHTLNMYEFYHVGIIPQEIDF